MATALCFMFGASVGLATWAFATRVDPVVDRLVSLLGPRLSARSAGPPGLLSRLGRTGLATRLADEKLIQRRLDLAGRGSSVEDIAGRKLALSILGVWASPLMALINPAVAMLAPVAGFALFRLPEFALARLGRRRQEAIAAQLPDFVDLLMATTEAGMGPQVAFRRSSEVLGGPLGEELQAALRHTDLGLPWRRAMEEMAHATDVPSLQRLVGTLAHSQRLGASVRTALQAMVTDLRSERRSRAEEAARRAPVKMLFPLVFLILPAFLLLTVGPVLLATVRSLAR